MELLVILVSIWGIATVCFGLIWYIREQHNDAYYERQETREQLQKFLSNAEDERRNLYDRLMAGTLPAYKEHEDAPNVVEEEADEIVALDEAKEELMNG